MKVAAEKKAEFEKEAKKILEEREKEMTFAPNVPKQCFCDDRKTFTAASDISAIMDYWVEQSMMTTQE